MTIEQFVVGLCFVGLLVGYVTFAIIFVRFRMGEIDE